jgi:hypothetical protein
MAQISPTSYPQLWFISHAFNTTILVKFKKQRKIHIMILMFMFEDIECAGRQGAFPEAKRDPVIQIANYVTVQGLNQRNHNTFWKNQSFISYHSQLSER